MQVSDSSLRILAGLLEARTGQQLTMSRRWRVETALSSLLRERGIVTLDELITILVMGKEPSLSQRVVEALLNNETYFFRDRLPFDQLSQTALPALALRRRDAKRIRIWSAGCSTGQELYSLAMLFAEDPLRWQGWSIELMGSDVSETVVNRARTGLYTQFEAQRGLGITQMIRWFSESEAGWRVAEALRRTVRFEVHNILEAPPRPGQFDIILCRNVLLYLSGDKKRAAFERLSQALAPDGWLMLGAGETVIGQTEKLVADREWRGLYRHVGSGNEERRAARA